MPKLSHYTLIWSEVHQHYDLHSDGQLEQCFRPEDEPAFSGWLAGHSSFAFWGRAGRIFVLKEARPHGAGYWYAYSTRARHTRKRYLGRTANVSFARLEEEAKVLVSSPSPATSPPQQKIAASSARQAETGREESRPHISHHDKQREVLLATKLSPPRLPISLVERERLLRELDMVHAHPLTLVSASAGSGKTTLLSAWVAASSKPHAREGTVQGVKSAFAWLSLDALDNEPIRFWASVIAALRTCLPTIGETALAMLHTPQSPPLSTILTALLNELLGEGRALTLILDDCHVITHPVIHETLLFFLDHLPPTLHLVLATRTDPELPLSRLRVRGQLLEIRDRDLRFTGAETASFLTQGMGLALSKEDVTTLEHRTEGWIAGLIPLPRPHSGTGLNRNVWRHSP